MKYIHKRYTDFMGVPHSVVGFISTVVLIASATITIGFGWLISHEMLFNVALGALFIFAADMIILYILDKR